VTVTDLERSTRWYSELFSAAPVLDEDEEIGGFHHTVFLLDRGQLFGLHTHPRTEGDRFDEHRTGLDHVSFACRDRGELQTWATRLDELGIQHGEIKDANYGSGVSFRDPDGIALEFFAPPEQQRHKRRHLDAHDPAARRSSREFHPDRRFRLGRPGPLTLCRSTCHMWRMPCHVCDWWDLSPVGHSPAWR